MGRALVLQLYRSALRAARELELAAEARGIEPRDELLKLPLSVLRDSVHHTTRHATRTRGRIKDHFRMHMRYSVTEDIDEAINLGFEAVKLARIRTAFLRSTDADESVRDDVAFPIGTVFRHRKYGYRAVIVGHDATCQAGERWQRLNHVAIVDQPFYNAVVDERDREEGFRETYVAQSNIEPAAEPVFNQEVEKFFLKFQPMTGSYVARAWLLHEYPDL